MCSDIIAQDNAENEYTCSMKLSSPVQDCGEQVGMTTALVCPGLSVPVTVSVECPLCELASQMCACEHLSVTSVAKPFDVPEHFNSPFEDVPAVVSEHPASQEESKEGKAGKSELVLCQSASCSLRTAQISHEVHSASARVAGANTDSVHGNENQSLGTDSQLVTTPTSPPPALFPRDTTGELANTGNGVFLWKIPDIATRLREAISGTRPCVYSPEFSVSQTCRACVRLYLNGDGVGKGSHISVFLDFHRSAHDNLSQGPFKHEVKIAMLDHSTSTVGRERSVTKSAHLRRSTEMNIAFPKFASKEIFEKHFLLDDALHFVISFSGI